jgi:uncharacterized protein YeaC (DUF1315 family)
MNLDELIASMTPEIYLNMKQAIELGRWGDGRTITSEQKEFSIEAMIRYEHLNNIVETDRVGYVDTTKKKQKSGTKIQSDTQPIKIIE